MMKQKKSSSSSDTTWELILGVLLLVVVVVVVVLLWTGGEFEEVAEWKEGEWLDIVLACPPSYKVAMLALLKSLSENSEPEQTRIWIFQEKEDNEEAHILSILRTENIFPVENVWFINYTNSEYLESLLTKIEEDFDSQTTLPSFHHHFLPRHTTSPLASHTSDIPEEETKNRNHKLMVDQHNYIRFYIPSIFRTLPSLSPSSFSSASSYPPKPRQFLYLDCDMIAVRDPMILMNQVAPHLGKGIQTMEEKEQEIEKQKEKERQRIEEEKTPPWITEAKREGEKEKEREKEGEKEGRKEGGEWEGKMCLAAAERSDPLLVDSLGRGEEAQKIVQELGVDSALKSFNAGMLVIDTDCWHETQALERILFWMELRTQRPVYQKGSQPPLLLSFVPQGSSFVNASELYPRPMEYFVVGDEWDFQARNLGHTHDKVGIIHYNGKKKPWVNIIEDETQQKTWDQYALPSLLPPDRPLTPPDETSMEKAARREKGVQRELRRKREKEMREIMRVREREERAREREKEKEERERERERRKEEKERLRQMNYEEREREREKERERKEKERAEREGLREKERETKRENRIFNARDPKRKRRFFPNEGEEEDGSGSWEWLGQMGEKMKGFTEWNRADEVPRRRRFRNDRID